MNLKKLMKQTNTKRETLAKELNIPLSTLDNYIAERREPKIEILMEIAKYFNVSLDELCGYDKYNKSSNIKTFNEDINKCYNLLISMSDEHIRMTYAYMQGLTEQEI